MKELSKLTKNVLQFPQNKLHCRKPDASNIASENIEMAVLNNYFLTTFTVEQDDNISNTSEKLNESTMWGH